MTKPEVEKGSAFSLSEVILLVAILVILAGVIVLALNPTKQSITARDNKRQEDVNSIVNAIYQYELDNNRMLPAGITMATKEICKSNSDCRGLVDLSVLNKYLRSIPSDPVQATTNGTDYYIIRSASGQITVSAPGTEGGSTIVATK